jgi:hypothetical protein
MVLCTNRVNLPLYALAPSKTRECLLIPNSIYTIMSMTYFLFSLSGLIGSVIFSLSSLDIPIYISYLQFSMCACFMEFTSLLSLTSSKASSGSSRVFVIVDVAVMCNINI